MQCLIRKRGQKVQAFSHEREEPKKLLLLGDADITGDKPERWSRQIDEQSSVRDNLKYEPAFAAIFLHFFDIVAIHYISQSEKLAENRIKNDQKQSVKTWLIF